MENQTTTEEGGVDAADTQNQNADSIGKKSLNQADLAEMFRNERVAAEEPQASDDGADGQEDSEAGANGESESDVAQSKETQAGQKDDGIDPDTKSVLSQSALSEKSKLKIGRSIGQYASRAKAAEAERDSVKTELAQLRQQFAAMQQGATQRQGQQAPATTAAGGDDPLASINDDAALDKFASEQQQIVDRYEEIQRDLFRASAQGQTQIELDGKAYDIDDLDKLYRRSRKFLERSIPARRQHLSEYKSKIQNSVMFAREVMPDAFDQTKPEAQQAMALARAYPELARHSDGPGLISLLVLGLKTHNQAKANQQQGGRQTAAATTTTAKPTTQRVPNLGGSGEALSRVNRDDGEARRRQVAAAAKSKLLKSGSVGDLAEFFKASR